MLIKFVFPGSFSPPTYGHLRVVQMASKVLPHLTIVCSRNPNKDYWFTEDECAELWSAYDLPKNVEVTTFTKVSHEKVDFKDLTMVRGLRTPRDLKDEVPVMDFNFQRFGINKYLYLVTEFEYHDISSSEARKAAKNSDLGRLSQIVAPTIAGALVKKLVEKGFKND